MLNRRVSDYQKLFYKERKTLKNVYLATINSLAYAIEARDNYTRGHSERVATFAVWMGERLGLSRRRILLLQQCARLHDVGKIGVPDRILLKPDVLTLEERAQVELHPIYGMEILGNLKFINKGLGQILHHHERYDGRGYPYGLRKTQIPIEVRILSIVDAFDAMTTDRPYRKAMPMHEVMNELKKCSGGQFDPRLVKIFLEIMRLTNPRIMPLEHRKAA